MKKMLSLVLDSNDSGREMVEIKQLLFVVAEYIAFFLLI